LGFSLVFGLGAIEEFIDVFFGHDVLLMILGGGFIIGEGFVEFCGAVFPEGVEVEGSEDVGDVPREGGHPCHFLSLLPFGLILFLMHNDYYYIR
jgi:hypothetical protein